MQETNEIAKHMQTLKGLHKGLAVGLAFVLMISMMGSLAVKAAEESEAGAVVEGYELTKDQAADAAGIALTQVGYREGWNNDNQYSPAVGAGNHVAWCGAFVSWCAMEAGVSEEVVPRTASLEVLRGCGEFYAAGSKEESPMPGDILFFGYGAGSLEHVGLVVDYADGLITYVQGNWSDSVAKSTIAWESGAVNESWQELLGVVRPAYEKPGDEAELVMVTEPDISVPRHEESGAVWLIV